MADQEFKVWIGCPHMEGFTIFLHRNSLTLQITKRGLLKSVVRMKRGNIKPRSGEVQYKKSIGEALQSALLRVEPRCGSTEVSQPLTIKRVVGGYTSRRDRVCRGVSKILVLFKLFAANVCRIWTYGRSRKCGLRDLRWAYEPTVAFGSHHPHLT
jgi:hypothetical protein